MPEALMRLNTAPEVSPTNHAALEGLRKRLDAWGISNASYQLVDGSGLPALRRDLGRCRPLLCSSEWRIRAQNRHSSLASLLPVSTARSQRRMKGTPARTTCAHKTGTMSNIRTLAGYVTTRDGERLAFVVLINNFEGTGANANDALTRSRSGSHRSQGNHKD